MVLYYLFALLSYFPFLLVMPYYFGAFGDLYAVLRARTLVNGLGTREELSGFNWPDEEALENAMRPDKPVMPPSGID